MPLKKIRTSEVQAYIDESKGLERDYLNELVKSRRTAWRVAATAIGASAVACLTLAVYVQANRHPPPPAIIEVNKTTGAVDYLSRLSTHTINPGWAVSKQYINTYVLDREGYDYDTIQQTYNVTNVMSTQTVAAAFQKAHYSGPNARQKKLADRAKIIVTVNSIIPGADKTATVDFSTVTKYQDGRTVGPKFWVATLSYAYSAGAETEDVRRIDGLGFIVTSYQVNPETPGK